MMKRCKYVDKYYKHRCKNRVIENAMQEPTDFCPLHQGGQD